VRLLLARAALAALALLALPGCDKLLGNAKSPFKGIDVTGGAMGGELRLTDHDGRPRSLADFRGKVVLVFFGFANCPDVCPTTLADIAAARKLLGADAARVQGVMVTVDPHRDTPQLLKQYVTAFDPSFIGLYGDDAALKKATQDFKVYWEVREGRTPESYTVNHSGQVYVIDREGRARLLFPPGTAPAVMAADIRVLLDRS
jgi:protein SCO1/2